MMGNSVHPVDQKEPRQRTNIRGAGISELGLSESGLEEAVAGTDQDEEARVAVSRGLPDYFVR